MYINIRPMTFDSDSRSRQSKKLFTMKQYTPRERTQIVEEEE